MAGILISFDAVFGTFVRCIIKAIAQDFNVCTLIAFLPRLEAWWWERRRERGRE